MKMSCEKEVKRERAFEENYPFLKLGIVNAIETYNLTQTNFRCTILLNHFLAKNVDSRII